MTWLVSYSYRALNVVGDRVVFGATTDHAVEIIDEHPAKFVAAMRRRANQLFEDVDAGRKPASDRADQIGALYLALELPAGTLTAAEVDALS